MDRFHEQNQNHERNISSSSEHPLLLLPWYVNDTLSESERRRVEAHLGTCDSCRREVERLRRWAREMQAIWQPERPSPLTWRRIQNRLDAEDRAGTDSARRSSSGRHGGAWKWLGGVAAAMLFVLQAALIHGQLSALPSKERTSFYQPLSGDAASAEAAIQVRFKETASVAQVTALLRRLSLEIVSGPGSLGIYGLRPEETSTDEVLKERAAALQASGLAEEVLLP